MQVSSQLSRAWDAFDAYMFDIDGTLLNCKDAVHYFAFCNALSTIAGRPLNLDGVVAHGNTDEGICRDAFALAGVEPAEWRLRVEEMREIVGSDVERNGHQMRIEVLPGVREVLTHLVQKGATLSTATGNLARVGRVKLEQAQLQQFFPVGGWSDTCETRSAVFSKAADQLRALLGHNTAICVVGDTPADVLAARDNGLEVIAVATGIFSRRDLDATEPDLCIDQMTDLLHMPNRRY